MVSVQWPSPRRSLYRHPPRSVRNRGGWFKKPTQGDGAKAQGLASCYWRVYWRHAVVGLTSGSAVAIPAAPVKPPPGRLSFVLAHSARGVRREQHGNRDDVAMPRLWPAAEELAGVSAPVRRPGGRNRVYTRHQR